MIVNSWNNLDNYSWKTLQGFIMIHSAASSSCNHRSFRERGNEVAGGKRSTIKV